MRIALLSDIHGNLISLEAVLADLGQERVDQIICLGDVAASGPQPHATVERVRALSCPVVMGNADAWLLNPELSEALDEAARQIQDVDLWCAEQLTSADLDFLRTFQPTVEAPLGGRATLLGFHGSPRSNTDVIGPTTPEEELEYMLSGFSATLLAGGHTHEQMLRRYRDVTLLNPGSVGLPFERDRQSGQALNPSWAEYALVSWREGRLSIELRRTPIDARAVRRAVLDSGMPHAAAWAKDWEA